MQENRRSFLSLSKRPQEAPWQAFCRRVQRALDTVMTDEQERDGYHFAHIVLNELDDLPSLRQLCQEYDVAMVQEGTATAATMIGRSALIVGTGPRLQGTEALGEHACLALPGTRVAQMQAMGFEQFARVPSELTLAQWLAIAFIVAASIGCATTSPAPPVTDTERDKQ